MFYVILFLISFIVFSVLIIQRKKKEERKKMDEILKEEFSKINIEITSRHQKSQDVKKGTMPVRDFFGDDIFSISKEELDELREEVEKERVENDAWKADYDKLIEIRNDARECDKNKEYEKAIYLYQNVVLFGAKSPRLNIYNYAFDIDRLIILYGKTKQYKELKALLSSSVSKYSDYRNVDNWKLRLEKVNKKLEK